MSWSSRDRRSGAPAAPRAAGDAVECRRRHTAVAREPGVRCAGAVRPPTGAVGCLLPPSAAEPCTSPRGARTGSAPGSRGRGPPPGSASRTAPDSAVVVGRTLPLRARSAEPGRTPGRARPNPRPSPAGGRPGLGHASPGRTTAVPSPSAHPRAAPGRHVAPRLPPPTGVLACTTAMATTPTGARGPVGRRARRSDRRYSFDLVGQSQFFARKVIDSAGHRDFRPGGRIPTYRPPL